MRGNSLCSQCRLAALVLAGVVYNLSGCTQLFFQPDRQTVFHPRDLGLASEDVYLNTPDGLRLHAWWLPAIGPVRGTVLFLHGNAENISTHIRSVAWLPAQGFNVFLPDYRGYGESQGTATMAGVHTDAETALAYLARQPERNGTPLWVFGQSLGGAVALRTVAQSPYRAAVCAVVVESAFSSPRLIAREKLASLWLTWPLQWPLSFLFSDAYSPLAVVDRISPIPLLLIHGDADPVVPVSHAQRLHAAARDPKTLWIVPDGRHIDATLRPELRTRLLAYLEWITATGTISHTPQK
ncbi:MAG: alpha/beta hydrolase [Nevskiales bacterium]|nr:alpha/beta hydrolase [Nevskiales bacterium]